MANWPVGPSGRASPVLTIARGSGPPQAPQGPGGPQAYIVGGSLGGGVPIFIFSRWIFDIFFVVSVVVVETFFSWRRCRHRTIFYWFSIYYWGGARRRRSDFIFER